jgi:hypothetical protein
MEHVGNYEARAFEDATDARLRYGLFRPARVSAHYMRR